MIKPSEVMPDGSIPSKQLPNGEWLIKWDTHFASITGISEWQFTDLYTLRVRPPGFKKRPGAFQYQGKRWFVICFQGKDRIVATPDGESWQEFNERDVTWEFSRYLNSSLVNSYQNKGKPRGMYISSGDPRTGRGSFNRWITGNGGKANLKCKACSQKPTSKNYKLWNHEQWIAVDFRNGQDVKVQCCTEKCFKRVTEKAKEKKECYRAQQMEIQLMYEAKVAMNAIKRYCSKSRRGVSSTPKKASKQASNSQAS